MASARFGRKDMLGTIELWLVRHGETAWSITGQHSGRIDLPLTIHGEEEARAVGGLLERRRFELVLCSPLRRALRGAVSSCTWHHGEAYLGSYRHRMNPKETAG